MQHTVYSTAKNSNEKMHRKFYGYHGHEHFSNYNRESLGNCTNHSQNDSNTQPMGSCTNHSQNNSNTQPMGSCGNHSQNNSNTQPMGSCSEPQGYMPNQNNYSKPL